MTLRSRHGNTLLGLAIALLLISGCQIQSKPKSKESAKPNFLFIAIDDLYTSIGASKDANDSFLKIIYPDDAIRAKIAAKLTPNIDKLASEGRQFTNNTCLSPLCGPSRTALLTGIPTHVSGYYMHDENFRTYKTLKEVITLPQYLKNKGYFTSGIGKIFHKPNIDQLSDEGDWPDARYSWDAWVSHGGGAGMGGAQLPAMSPTKSNMKFGAGDEPKTETSDWQNSSFTARLLETGTSSINDNFTKNDVTINIPKDKPFFIASGIFRPHLPFFAPKAYFDLFPTSEMKIDEELMNWIIADLNDLPPAALKWTQLTNGKFEEIISQGEKVGGQKGKVEAWKQCIQAYLACVAFADECVGEILRGLETGPYKNNTVVILWSDHGYFLGDKARIAKQCLWFESIKSNLIIKLPENQKMAGTSSNEFVQLTDLYPTVVSLAGLEKPAHVMGEDITSLIKDPKAELKRAYTFSTYQEGNHTLFNNDYKYIKYKNGDTELYNLQSDPFEYKNLAYLKEYVSVLNDLDRVLETELSNAKKYSIK